MTSSPSKPSYKWWESDDKTKRLYTELLAEKIAKSPKKSASTLMKSASSCSDLRSRLEALEGKGTPPGSPVKRSSSIRSLTSSDKINSAQQSPKKYTFETVTMDTLAKYEYIKSPKKKALGSMSSPLSSSASTSSLSSLSSPSPGPPSSGSDEEYDKKISSWRMYERKSSSSSSSSVSSREDDSIDSKPWMFKGNDKNSKEQERWGYLTKGSNNERCKQPTTPSKGGLSSKSTTDSDKWKPNSMFMLMTSSSKPELKSFGAKAYDTGTPLRKERSVSKLSEVPEYSSSSSDDSSDSGRATTRSFTRAKDEVQNKSSTSYQRNDLISFKETRKDNNKNSNTNNDALDERREFRSMNTTNEDTKPKASTGDEDEELDIAQITKKFHALCETVEQLEFKMFEFSNDIQKLKHSMGMKDKDRDNHVEINSPKHHFRHSFTLSAGKDLLSERSTARALLMRQYASPSKSPMNISKLMKDTGIDKEMAEADASKTKVLEDELRKVLDIAKINFK